MTFCLCRHTDVHVYTLTHRANTCQLLKEIILVCVISIYYTLISTSRNRLAFSATHSSACRGLLTSVSKHLSADALQGDSSSSDRGGRRCQSRFLHHITHRSMKLSTWLQAELLKAARVCVEINSARGRPGGCKPVRSHIRISSRGLQPFRRF